MARSYYARSDRPGSTMTARQLIEQLQALPDLDLPIVFKSPPFGAYGPLHAYSVDKVELQEFARETLHHPARTEYDDETGEPYEIEAEDQVFEAWRGIVIE